MLPWMLILLRSNLILLSWNSPVDLDSSHAFPTGSPPVIAFFFLSLSLTSSISSCCLQISSFAFIFFLLLLKISFLCYHHDELLWFPPPKKNAEGHMVWPSFWEGLGQSLVILCQECVFAYVCVRVSVHSFASWIFRASWETRGYLKCCSHRGGLHSN